MTIREYCKDKHISVKAFCKICNIGYDYIINNIADKENPNVKLSTAKKIYEGTKQNFGTGLTMDQYTNIGSEKFLFTPSTK